MRNHSCTKRDVLIVLVKCHTYWKCTLNEGIVRGINIIHAPLNSTYTSARCLKRLFPLNHCLYRLYRFIS